MTEPGDRIPPLGPRGEGWVVLQVLLMVAVLAGAFAAPAWAGLVRLCSVALGAVLAAAGAALAVVSLRQLGKSLTALPAPLERGELVETGVYRRARHPIYGGLLLGCYGWGLAWASVPALAAAVALTGVLFLKSLREEAWLVRKYPGYPDYRTRTRRFLPLPR